MAAPRYRLYEIVRVRKDNPELAEIHGERGAILGIADSEGSKYDYGVFMYRDEVVWQLAEEDLEPTGEHARREDFYDDTVVRVEVDEKGRGRIAGSAPEHGGSSDQGGARGGSNVVAVTLGFVAALYLAWTGAWLLLLRVERDLGWPLIGSEPTLYWIVMRLLLWIAPSLFVFRYAGIRVGEAMKGDGIRPALLWGLGAGLLIGFQAVALKWLGGQPFSLTPSWAFASVVLVAPFVEEFVFRGAVMGGLMKRCSEALSNVIASLLFVGAHVPGWSFSGVLVERLTQPVGGALSIFVLGLIFGFVVQKSRSLVAGMIAHSVNNFFSVL